MNIIVRIRLRTNNDNNIDNDDKQYYFPSPHCPLSREAFSLTSRSGEMRQLSANIQYKEVDVSANTCDTNCKYSDKQIMTKWKIAHMFHIHLHACMHAERTHSVTNPSLSARGAMPNKLNINIYPCHHPQHSVQSARHLGRFQDSLELPNRIFSVPQTTLATKISLWLTRVSMSVGRRSTWTLGSHKFTQTMSFTRALFWLWWHHSDDASCYDDITCNTTTSFEGSARQREWTWEALRLTAIMAIGMEGMRMFSLVPNRISPKLLLRYTVHFVEATRLPRSSGTSMSSSISSISVVVGSNLGLFTLNTACPPDFGFWFSVRRLWVSKDSVLSCKEQKVISNDRPTWRQINNIVEEEAPRNVSNRFQYLCMQCTWPLDRLNDDHPMHMSSQTWLWNKTRLPVWVSECLSVCLCVCVYGHRRVTIHAFDNLRIQLKIWRDPIHPALHCTVTGGLD